MGSILAAVLKWAGPAIGKQLLARLVRRRFAGKIDGWLEQRGLSVDSRDAVFDAMGVKHPRRRNEIKPDSSADDWHSDGA